MILLAKHSQPFVDPSILPAMWTLSAAGRRRALALAASVRHRKPTRVISSPERKAIETSEIVAASLHLDVEVNDELREHERPSLPFAASRDAFESALATAFARPTDTIYGGESVEGARSRFASAIARILASPGDGTPLVVTHGTVLASYVASVTGCDPVPLWRGLDLPSWLALDLVAGAIVDSWRVTPHP